MISTCAPLVFFVVAAVVVAVVEAVVEAAVLLEAAEGSFVVVVDGF